MWLLFCPINSFFPAEDKGRLADYFHLRQLSQMKYNAPPPVGLKNEREKG